MNSLNNIFHIAFMLVLLSLAGISEVTAKQSSGRKSVEVNGATIEYVEQGTGPLMILAHGGLGDYRSWEKVHMPLLSENFRVVSYSMRYYGSIDWEESWPPLTLDLYADDLAGLIKFFDVGPAYLVGFSLGAEVAHTTALKYADLVRSAYLYEGVANIEKFSEIAEEDKKMRAALFDPIVAAHKEGNQTAAVRSLIDSVGGESGIFDSLPESAQSFVTTKSDALAKYIDRKELITYDCKQVRNSKVPTTLVVGTSSVNYFQTVILKHNLPCFGEERITHIEDAGHLWPSRDAQGFVNSVVDFSLKH